MSWDDSRIAVREAWKRQFGKYPMDTPSLRPEQRREDRDVARIQELQERVAELEKNNEELTDWVNRCTHFVAKGKQP